MIKKIYFKANLYQKHVTTRNQISAKEIKQHYKHTHTSVKINIIILVETKFTTQLIDFISQEL